MTSDKDDAIVGHLQTLTHAVAQMAGDVRDIRDFLHKQAQDRKEAMEHLAIEQIPRQDLP